MLYLDTSFVVAMFTNEARTHDVQDWLVERASGPVTISDWVITEFSGALSIKLRTRQISAVNRANALASFQQVASTVVSILPVTRLHFRTGARFADHHELGLRSGDALHLAIASDHGAELCTLDRRLADAGPVLGVPTHLL